MWLTISSGRTWHGEICNRKKGGGLYWVETTIVPSLGEDGLSCQYVSMRTEITGIKQAEATLVRIKAELEKLVQERTTELEQVKSHLLQSDKMASIGQLAAGVAHEINNPIGYVYSNLGTLEKYVQDTFCMLDLYEQAEGAIADAEVRAQLKAAKDKLDIAFIKEDLRSLMDESKDGITRVKNIVQNLKDFSHVDTTDEWHFSDLHHGLDSTLNIVSNEIKYKADVIKEYGDLPDVEYLSSQLNQVFMNLLVNAAHAIDERGTITIRTGRQCDEGLGGNLRYRSWSRAGAHGEDFRSIFHHQTHRQGNRARLVAFLRNFAETSWPNRGAERNWPRHDLPRVRAGQPATERAGMNQEYAGLFEGGGKHG